MFRRLPLYASTKCRFLTSKPVEKTVDPSEPGANLSELRPIFDKIGASVGIKRLDDWYALSTTQFREHGGATILSRKLGGKLSASLPLVYPEHKWEIFKFRNMSKNIFATEQRQREYFDWLGAQLGVLSPEDWYALMPSSTELIRMGAASLLKRYSGSSILALQHLYPEHRFAPWKFKRVPRKFWDQFETRRLYFDSLAEQLGFNPTANPEAWYRFDRDTLAQFGGWTIAMKFKTLCNALNATYPEHRFLEWRFSAVPSGFWRDARNRRRFLLWLAREQRLIEQSIDDENGQVDFEKFYELQWDHVENQGGTLKIGSICLFVCFLVSI